MGHVTVTMISELAEIDRGKNRTRNNIFLTIPYDADKKIFRVKFLSYMAQSYHLKVRT